MLPIVGTFRFPADHMAQARPAMARMIAATRAEDGCDFYAFAEDLLDPGLIRVSERWRDTAALAAHAASAHMAEWRAAGAALGVGERDLMLYEVADAKVL